MFKVLERGDSEVDINETKQIKSVVYKEGMFKVSERGHGDKAS